MGPNNIDRCLWLAAGQDDPHSQTIIELCAELTALRAKLDNTERELREIAQHTFDSGTPISSWRGRAEAAEAKLDEAREALDLIRLGDWHWTGDELQSRKPGPFSQIASGALRTLGGGE